MDTTALQTPTRQTSTAKQEYAAEFNVSPYHDSKAIWHQLIGVVLLVLASPVIACLIVFVRATSRGAGIYKQTRVGKDGREFKIYKVRTMHIDAEASGTPQWAVRKDKRVTRLGRFLRFSHLDELPQLLNVAKGEMVLIGPRPERPEFVDKLSLHVPNYLDRLAVLPGVTGLAQINLPPDESLESVRQKVILDRDYIQQASLGLELRIFFCTLLRLFGLRHGIAPKLFGIERILTTEQAAQDPLRDTLELYGALDDTAVNIPTSIAGPPSPAAATHAFSLSEEKTLSNVATSVAPAVESEEALADATASTAPRNPR